jgi:hypothetical protein
MLRALEHIRKMRGGAQSHLMRCSDGGYYVVKFLNNPQHPRILVNEMLGTSLAGRMGLPTVPCAVVEVDVELIRFTDDLTMEIGLSRVPCQPGLQFGAKYPGNPAEIPAFDYLPDLQLAELENLHDFAGMLVFDKWTCNTNGRQAIFYREAGRSRYQAVMIDQGFCFNAGEWNFPDAPLRGLYSRHRVYERVTGLDSFEPWLGRLQTRITKEVLDECASQIPPAWYGFDMDALYALLEKLEKRRNRVEEQIEESWKCSRQPFANWK